MKIQKVNKRILLLALILFIGFLMVTLGTTYARYLEEQRMGLVYEMQEPSKILMGIQEDDVFSQVQELEWIVEGETATLQFAVANGTSDTEYSPRDQILTLSMIGSLGIINNGELPTVSVVLTPEGSEEEIKTLEGQATAIKKGSALYHSYGSGWIYRFYEDTLEGPKELTWELPGGELSYVTFKVQVNGEILERFSILQPLVTAELISNE